jgi:hypothetical protein
MATTGSRQRPAGPSARRRVPYRAEQITEHRTVCSWWPLAAPAPLATPPIALPEALPEARPAVRLLRGRS